MQNLKTAQLLSSAGGGGGGRRGVSLGCTDTDAISPLDAGDRFQLERDVNNGIQYHLLPVINNVVCLPGLCL